MAMAIWDLNDHSEESASSFYPPTPPSLSFSEDPISPRLEISDIDAVPFSQNFSDLFEGLGLHTSSEMDQKCTNTPDASYYIENFTNLKDILPDWKNDEIEEIMIMSPKRPGSALPAIKENFLERNDCVIPEASLSDFEFEEPFAHSGPECWNDTKLCIRRDNRKKYLIKRKRCPRNAIWSERQILETLTCSSAAFISYMRWVFCAGEYMYMVTDQPEVGSLLDLINRHGVLSSNVAVFYASEIVVALSSLHEAGVVHRDLEPKNILLDADGHIVLTNFGHAEFLSTTRSKEYPGITKLGLSMSEYRAPELLLGWTHDASVDCWAFGMLLYLMFFGTHPFVSKETAGGDSELYNRIIRSPVPCEALRLVHPMARDLTLKCLERNPTMRWDMKMIKSHEYFELVDWDKVAAKKIDVPCVGWNAMEIQRNAITSDVQRKHASLTPSFLDAEIHLSSSTPRRPSAKGNSAIKQAPVLPELFKPTSNVSIPAVIQEEDEPDSTSGSAGHPSLHRPDGHPVDVDNTERMTRFWVNIDKDKNSASGSVNSLEFGKADGTPYTQAPKLRKHRSAIHSHRLFNLSTTSFQNKLRKKPRSTSTLRQPCQAEAVENLPIGIHQIGSGIGFTYNVPAAVPSQISVCSFAPSCNHLFNGGFSVLNRGLGIGHSSRKLKTKPDTTTAIPKPSTDEPVPWASVEVCEPDPHLTEVGNGTFIREMYRTPSWILSPPDSLPSPLALVNDSPATCSEPFTPATLVDCVDVSVTQGDEVNISISKTLEVEFDLSHLAPDTTLRLVPPSEFTSFGDVGEESLYSDMTSPRI